jgi:hypothetical protein
MFKKYTSLLVILMLAVVPPVFAQSDATITFGDMVEGTITDQATPMIYLFEAGEGDMISVTVLADDPSQLNLALDLISPSGTVEYSNADYYLQNPAFVEHHILESGTYQIAVRSESGTGGFIIFLDGEKGLTLGDVLYEETFDNNDKDWETNTDDDSVLFSDLVDGEYVIQYVTTESSYYWVVAPGFTDWTKAPIFDTPYQVTVDVSDVESSSDKYFLMVLFQGQANYECYDVLSFYPDGQWLFYGCGYQLVSSGTFDTAVDFSDGNTHTVGLQVEAYRLNILLDDQVVSYPINGLQYPQGSVGFGIGLDYDSKEPEGQERTAEAHFDNVIVREMK